MIYNDNCLTVLSTLPENSIDAILTDPPYGLSDHKQVDVEKCLAAWLKGEPFLTKKKGFLDNSWDGWVPGPEIWKECLRVLKPGGYMLAFAGCRTLDLMSLAIRLGGFRIHPQLAWLYGSGMPKGSNLSKQFDKGHERPVAYERKLHGGKHLLDTWHDGPQCSIYS
jgi:site-specific DNA-methyltransferase (adenine-specific)